MVQRNPRAINTGLPEQGASFGDAGVIAVHAKDNQLASLGQFVGKSAITAVENEAVSPSDPSCRKNLTCSLLALAPGCVGSVRSGGIRNSRHGEVQCIVEFEGLADNAALVGCDCANSILVTGFRLQPWQRDAMDRRRAWFPDLAVPLLPDAILDNAFTRFLGFPGDDRGVGGDESRVRWNAEDDWPGSLTRRGRQVRSGAIGIRLRPGRERRCGRSDRA